MAKRKVVHFINSMGQGGIQRQMIELVKILPGDQYENHIVVLDKEGFFGDEIINLKSILYIKRDRFFLLKAVIKTIRYCNSIQPDIIHSWNIFTLPVIAFALPFIKGRPAALNGTLQEAPIKISFSKKIIQKLFFPLFKYTQGNAFACLEAFSMRGKKNTYVIPNGFDPERIPLESKNELRKMLHFEEGLFYISIVASLNPLKDHKTFIDCAELCLKARTDLRFLIVGDGPLRNELEQYVIGKNSLENKVHFLGSRKDVEKILKASDVSVLATNPNQGEGIPNSIIESMACGTPVVATDKGGVNEVINDNDNGFLVPAGNSQIVSEKILYLLNNPSVKDSYSQKGSKLITEDFSVENMGKRFEKLYDRMINEHENLRIGVIE